MDRESQTAITHASSAPDTTIPDRAAQPAGNVKEQLKRLGPVGPLAIISMILPAIGGFTLLWTLQEVGPWLKSHGDLGITIYIACFVILSGCALLPTYAQAILGGWAFGFLAGFPAALAGLGGGALLGYFIGRLAAKERAVRLIDEHPKWRAVYEALVGSSFLRTLMIITLLRLPPNVPFSLTNLVMAATQVNPLAYILGTMLGMAPRTAMVVYLSSKAEKLDFTQAGDVWFGVVALILTVAVVGVIGYFAKQALDHVSNPGGSVSSNAKPQVAPVKTGPVAG